MCTICGHFAQGSEIVSTDIYDMLKKTEHRGPDTHGLFLDGVIHRVSEVDELRAPSLDESRIGLGHSRLSIVGREAFTQPYESCDGQLTLIHNGEIYNYQELQSMLMRHHDLQTSSDSEIIIHLLEETYEGDLLDAMKKVSGLLDGMYAIAVTDGRSIVVARDPIGKKPVYFVEDQETTYFASERKALWNGTDEPERLKPGEILEIDEERTRVHDVHPLPYPQIDIVDFREAVDLYKEMILKAVRKRLVGLRESAVGVIFSGGIDSVLIAKLLQQEGRNVLCYCTGTEDSGDVAAAREVADDLGLTLHTTIIDEEMVEGLLPEVIRDVEESGLLQVEVAIPMYLAARRAAEDDIRVMFTGQAADELWAGYPWYNAVLEEHSFLRLHERLWEDLNYLYEDTLEREDKLTMAHSIELRAPYLDRAVIQTAMRTSPRLKIQGPDDGMGKRVHRQAAEELGVPAYLAFREKDPAQSGSGIHGIIQKIAARKIAVHDEGLASRNIEADRGSLYRYETKAYGEDLTRAFLQEMEEEIKERFIPPFLAPDPDTEAQTV
ncbi:MAG: asparagine synthase (glutamine-hydrolyzing) [bacterium]